MSDDARAIARWRLLLGRFAEPRLGGCEGDYGRMDAALEFIYGREYRGRGVRGDDGPQGGDDRQGTLDPTQLTVPEWLAEVRELFPRETVEIIERDALQRYEMSELLTDASVLSRLEPSYALTRAVLSMRHLMKGEALEAARALVRRTVDDIARRVRPRVQTLLGGHARRGRPSPLGQGRLDLPRTVRENLKHYDGEERRLVVQSLWRTPSLRRHMPWHVVLAVDCSGSMIDSVIHSAVMAGVFSRLPTLRVSLLAFDTSVVDLSGLVDDPTELLMSVQLGGGTNIGQAVEYCESLITTPRRAVLVLVTDFCEGAPLSPLLAAIRRLRGAGVAVLGLAALDRDAAPVYDRRVAQACVDAGAEVAALTPGGLAEWLARILS